MAYETSTVTNPDGLLTALRAFAIAQGWTVNKWESQTNGYWLSLQKGSQYVNLVTDSTQTVLVGELWLLGATGFDGGLTATAQPGARTDSYKVPVNDLRAGSYVAYHFFGGDDFIHCVVEVSSGRYTHFGFGVLNKSGVYDGGEYVYGHRHYLDNLSIAGNGKSGNHWYPFTVGQSAQVRFTENDLTPVTNTYKDWARITGQCSSTAATLVGTSWSQTNIDANAYYTALGCGIVRQPNYFNGVSMLLPLTVMCGRRNNLTSILGEPKEMCYINIKGLVSGQEIVLGADTWLVFAIKQKGEQIAGSTTPFSWWHGLAFKKVV